VISEKRTSKIKTKNISSSNLDSVTTFKINVTFHSKTSYNTVTFRQQSPIWFDIMLLLLFTFSFCLTSLVFQSCFSKSKLWGFPKHAFTSQFPFLHSTTGIKASFWHFLG